MGFASDPSTWSPRERRAVEKQARSGRRTTSTEALRREQAVKKAKEAQQTGEVVTQVSGGPLRKGYVTEVIKRPVSGKGPVIREITAMPDPREDLRGKILITETVTEELGPTERATIWYKEKQAKIATYLKEKAPVLFGREGAFGAGPTEREVILMRDMPSPVMEYLEEKAPRIAKVWKGTEEFLGGAEVGAREQITEKPLTTGLAIGVGYGFGLIGAGATAIGGKVAVGMKGLGYGLGGLYVGTKSYEIYQAPTYYEKGKVFGGTITELGALGLGALGAGETVGFIKKSLTPTKVKYLSESGKAYIEAYKVGEDITIGKARDLTAIYKYEYPKDIFSRGIQKIATKFGRAPPKYAYLEAPTAEFVSVRIGKESFLASRFQYETVTKYPKGKTVTEFFEARGFAPKIKGLKHDIFGIGEKRGIQFKGFEIPPEKYFYIREKGLITGKGIWYETAKIGTQISIKGKAKYFPEKVLSWKLTKDPFPLTEIKGEYAIQTARARGLEITGKKTYITKYLETDPYFKTKVWETGAGKMPKGIDISKGIKLGRLDLPLPKELKVSIVKGDRLFSEVYTHLGKTTTRAIPTVTQKLFTEIIPKDLIKTVTIPKAEIVTIPSLRMKDFRIVKPVSIVDIGLSEKEMLDITPIQRMRERARTITRERERLGVMPMLDTRLIAKEKVGLREADIVGTITREIEKEKLLLRTDVRVAQRLDTRLDIGLMPVTFIGTGWGFPPGPPLALGRAKPLKPIRPTRKFEFFPSLKALAKRKYGKPFKFGVSVKERPITPGFLKQAKFISGILPRLRRKKKKKRKKKRR